jgi:hypothetical protein
MDARLAMRPDHADSVNKEELTGPVEKKPRHAAGSEVVHSP